MSTACVSVALCHVSVESALCDMSFIVSPLGPCVVQLVCRRVYYTTLNAIQHMKLSSRHHSADPGFGFMVDKSIAKGTRI